LNGRDSNRLVIAGFTAATSVFIGAVALFIAALQIGWNDASLWFIVLVQVLFSSLATIGCIILAMWCFKYVSEQVEELKRRHTEGAKSLPNVHQLLRRR